MAKGNLQDETWKQIKGHGGLYEISNHGRVRLTINELGICKCFRTLEDAVNFRKKVKGGSENG